MKIEQLGMNVESLQEKVGLMNALALDITDRSKLSQDEIRNKLTDEELDEIYGVADGLAEEYVMRIVEGRTSIKNISNNTPEVLEKYVDDIIKLIRNATKKLDVDYNPMCKIYTDSEAIPDEDGNCSLCGGECIE